MEWCKIATCFPSDSHPPSSRHLVLNLPGSETSIETEICPDEQHGEISRREQALQEALARTERALQESEKRYRGLIEDSGLGIYISRVQGERLFINRTLIRLLGYGSPEEINAVPTDQLIAEQDREKAASYRKAAIEASYKSGRYECDLVRKDGSNFPVHVILSRISWDGEDAVKSTIIDMSEREQSEQARRESEERLQEFIDNSPSLIYLKDLDSRILVINRAYQQHYGISQAEARGKDGVKWQGSKIVKILRKQDLKVISGGKPAETEVERTDADGNSIIMQSIKFPVRDAAGKIIGIGGIASDVTAQRQTEGSLEQKSALLQTTLDNMADGISVYDADLRLIAFNQIFIDLYQFPPGFIRPGIGYEDVARQLAEAGHYGAGNIDEQVRVRVERGRYATPRQIERTGKDGKTIAVCRKPLPGGGFISTFTDITERKTIEEAVRENEMRFRDLIESSVLGTSIADPNGRRIFANQAMAKLMGYNTADEIIALDRGKMVAPHDMAMARDHWSAMQRGKDVPPHYEIEIVHRDGHFIPVQCFCRKIVWEGVDAVQRIYIDLSERKQTERALFESEEKLRKAFENTGIGISIRNASDRTVTCNDALCKMLGYSRDELETLHLNDITHPDDRETNLRLRGELWAGDIDSFQITKRFIRKDGAPIWVINDLTTIRDDQGKVVFSINLFQDLTELKKAEEVLTQSVARAETANVAKSAFLANMSHELRTPLNAIIGFSDIIQSETFGTVGSPRYKEYAQDINEAGLHLLNLINDILDLSKIEAEKDELYEEALDVPSEIDSALSLVRQRAEKNNITIELKIEEDIPDLEADERKLKQILVNLLTNAIKFTKPGGTVTVSAWCRPDSGFVFQIVDTGIGIAPKDIPKALLQFGQVDSDLNRKYEGTGLGLPLTKALVELHGGSLDLQSEEGIGTIVTVRFPAWRIK